MADGSADIGDGIAVLVGGQHNRDCIIRVHVLQIRRCNDIVRPQCIYDGAGCIDRDDRDGVAVVQDNEYFALRLDSLCVQEFDRHVADCQDRLRILVVGHEQP